MIYDGIISKSPLGDILVHHGVKGQKWGVRNGPPYPIDDKTLIKGSKLSSVSIYSNPDQYKNRKTWMYTYNPSDSWDSKVYEGPFSVFKSQTTGMRMNKHTYEVTKDLRLATSQERFDEFKKLYTSDKRQGSKDLSRIQSMLKAQNVGSKSSQNVNLKNPKTDEDYKAVYEVFNHAMEFSDYFKTTRKYKDVMQSKFDGMVDDNNVKIYNDAHDPIIIFNPSEVLKNVSSVPLSTDNIINNYKYVRDELVKKGERVKL